MPASTLAFLVFSVVVICLFGMIVFGISAAVRNYKSYDACVCRLLAIDRNCNLCPVAIHCPSPSTASCLYVSVTVSRDGNVENVTLYPNRYNYYATHKKVCPI